MAWYPIGARTRKDIGTIPKRLSLPPLLILASVVNTIVLFVCTVLLVFTMPGDTTFTPVEQAMIALFGVIISGAVVWALATNRAISRFLIALNTLGVSILFVLLFGSDEALGLSMSLVVAAICCACGFYILKLDKITRNYYAVLSGDLPAEEYHPYSEGFVSLFSSFGDWVTLICEIAIATLALAIFGGWIFGWFEYLWADD